MSSPTASKPVAYSVGRQPELVDVAARLESALGWSPRLWITQPELEDAARDAFPAAELHDFTDLSRGRLPASSDLPPVPPDLLLRDGRLLRQGLEIEARHVLGRATTTEQQMHALLRRFDWAARTVKALDVQVLVLNATPHAPIDFALAAACRLLGRSLRILHLTGFRGLQVVLDDPEGRPLGLAAQAHLAGAELSEAGAAELEAQRAAAAAPRPWYVERQDARDATHARLYSAAEEILNAEAVPRGSTGFDAPPLLPEPALESQSEPPAALRWWGRAAPRAPDLASRDPFRRRFQPKHDAPMRRPFLHRPEGVRAAPITWREYYTYRDWASVTKLRWRRLYEGLAPPLELADLEATPFAFFAMHYQPERTTSPEGGLFSDQLAALRLIAEALPEGWRLLVKEHPSQFMWQTEGELGRWEGYHEAMADIPRLRLVPLDMDSAALVKVAAVTVTVTGTVGWEAALRGCPVVTLANPWYSGPGITLPARDAGGLRAAFAKAAGGWRPDPEALRAHLARLERVGRRCYMNPSHGTLYEDLDAAANAAALVDLFLAAEPEARP